jgi:N6-L-threonylcarbamoyladenine synthase/protein kinase Bud32
VPKSYRHERLDDRLRRDRTVLEARLTAEARRAGVPTPVVYDVDPVEATLTVEHVGDRELRALLTETDDEEGATDRTDRLATVGTHLARLHAAGLVHGDPTPRNVRVAPERTYLVDFGLGHHSDDAEDYAMDLHVLEGCLVGTTADAEGLIAALESGYREAGGEPAVIEGVRAIERRGRYRERE